ncbi:acyl-CoA dehydrogenase family protein [Bradyrhizobium sp. LHD-71]|uniref:acyl-CoA dehydrogenase family protein n=1 Tax=Bradyrhizobium sp. LHD-71 TaxID=3072141 RepID=UPI00280C447F|nr:acyl-CoA dehydrogenase family protein [Bradyrhizobium sp. LHD-71]MDQ8729730.1 acyl-CoA dehydrogenase family protein [Bradyrhizobium sp. LHD-71]
MARDTTSTKRAVDGILDLVRAATDEIERGRRLSDTVVAALRDTGINRLLIPAALGGIEAPIVDVMDMMERIAAVDGSAGWCAAIGSGSNIFAGYLPEAGARAVFADPDQGNATMFAPVGRVVIDHGHAKLTGRWPFTSNCLHSAWAGLGALFEEADGLDPVPRVVFVPMADLKIEDTWDVAGLRGTGSHHVSAAEVAVHSDRCARFTDRPWPDGTLWRLPIYTVLLPVLVAVPIGIARGAVDEIARQAREGRTARRGQLADTPISMAEFAGADARLRAARAALREVVVEAHALAERGEPVGRQLQARIYLACLHACDTSVEVTSVTHQLGGGAAAYRNSRLLRALCDVQAARQHQLFSHHHLPELGRLVAGLDVAYPPYIR